MENFDVGVLLSLLLVIGIDLILSGDNAVVIALAVRNLEGSVRRRAILLGVGGAVALRLIFVTIISFLVGVPLIYLVGGLVLIYIAWNLSQEEEGEKDIKAGSGLWSAMRTIIIADAVMSFDNVVALVAASRDANGDPRVWLVAFGIALSIPLVIFGSTILSGLMNRFPIIVYLGAGLLVYLAFEMFFDEPLLQGISHATEGLHLIIAIGAALIFTAFAYFWSRRKAQTA